MNQAQNRDFRPIEGEIIGQSVLKLVGLFVFSLLALPAGIWAVWVWWTGATLLGYSLNWWGAALGAVFVLIGLFGMPTFLLSIFRRQCLILGEDRLQLATEKGSVFTQIPYRNIARMELIREDTGKYIGIDLHDTEDADTLNKDAGTTKKWSGWHYKLGDDSWTMPIEEIHARLKSRVQCKQAEH